MTARCRLLSCFVLFVVVLWCLVGPVCHCDHLVGENKLVAFGFHWFVTCVLSVVVCLLFLRLCLLSLCLVLDILYSFNKHRIRGFRP